MANAQNDYEIVDYTVVSEFEKFVNELSRAFTEQTDTIIEFKNTSFTVRRSKNEFLSMMEFVDKDLLYVIEPNTIVRNFKMASSAAKMAAVDVGLDCCVLVGSGSLGKFEGFVINADSIWTINSISLPYLPDECGELKNLAKILKGRYAADIEPKVAISVLYYLPRHGILNSATWSLQDFNVQQKSASHSVALRVDFGKESYAEYAEFKIHPDLSGDWWVVLNPNVYPKSTLKAMLLETFDYISRSTLNKINNTWEYSYIPGGFEMNDYDDISSRYVDPRNIEEAVHSIFDLTDSNDETIPESIRTTAIIAHLRFKSLTVPTHSLIWKIAVHLFDCTSPKPFFLSFRAGFMALFKGIWTQMIRRIQQYFDHSIMIPTVEMISDNDDLTIPREHMLIHQKLCMLNCCIFQKQRSEQLQTNEYVQVEKISDFKDRYGTSWNSDLSWEGIPKVAEVEVSPDIVDLSEELIPKGRKRHVKGCNLENGTQIWEPITQVSCPLTDDMIFEQERIVQEMSSLTEEDKIRLQSKNLVSDMQAFKAANPEAIFEDFVKWHSPRDYVNGKLSERFSSNENIWKKLWRECMPLPAHEQKPLFDFEKEAARVFNYFDSLSISEILGQFAPTFLLVAYDSLLTRSKSLKIPAVLTSLQDLGAHLAKIDSNDFPYSQLVDHFASTERCVVLAEFLLKIFDDIDLIDVLLRNGKFNVSVRNRESTRSLFAATDNFGAPAEKIYELEIPGHRVQYTISESTFDLIEIIDTFAD